jgi:hypothetical protein
MHNPSHVKILLLHALECKNKKQSCIDGFEFRRFWNCQDIQDLVIRHLSTDLGVLGISTFRRSKLPPLKEEGHFRNLRQF